MRSLRFWFWRIRHDRRMRRWKPAPIRNDEGLINHVHNGEVLRLAVVNAIEHDLGLEQSTQERQVGEWWRYIADMCCLPDNEALKDMCGESFPFPASLINAAIDITNHRVDRVAA